MKSITVLFVLFGIFQSVLSQNTTNWKLVWSDEFDGATLDLSKWAYQIDCRGKFTNGEAQCYTNRESNVRVANGSLVITAVPEKYTMTLGDTCTENITNYCQGSRDFTSGRIRTKFSPTGSWTYGKFEFRSKLPKGDYLWPALWMLSTDQKFGVWAASGEIDIMEARGQDPYSIEGTIHYGGKFPYKASSGSGPRSFQPTDFTSDFHIFGLEWTPDSLAWFVDGTKYHEENLDRSFYPGGNPNGNPYTADRQPFDQRFHVIINLAVGGSFVGGVPSFDQGQQWANPHFVVDYVRVYQQ